MSQIAGALMNGEHRGIYLDYAASTPTDPTVWDLMGRISTTSYGNASAQHHSWGSDAARWVSLATRDLSNLVGCDPEELIFTSGATESNSLVFSSVAFHAASRPIHVVLSAFEHASILNWVPELRRSGVAVSLVKPGRDGIVPLSVLQAEIRPETVLVSIIAVQNEIGTVQRIRDIAKLLEGSGVLLHTDAAQAIGRIDIQAALAGADLISLSGHKCYGPKGVGALVVRAGCAGFIHPIFFGGNQQHGYRPGTLAVPLIVGFAEAAHLAESRRGVALSEIAEHESLFLAELRGWFPDILPLVASEDRVPGILSIRFPGVDAEQLLSHNRYIAISAGSACHSGIPGASPVLLALGLPNDAAGECVRICISHLTTSYEIEEAARQLAESAAQLATRSYFASAPVA